MASMKPRNKDDSVVNFVFLTSTSTKIFSPFWFWKRHLGKMKHKYVIYHVDVWSKLTSGDAEVSSVHYELANGVPFPTPGLHYKRDLYKRSINEHQRPNWTLAPAKDFQKYLASEMRQDLINILTSLGVKSIMNSSSMSESKSDVVSANADTTHGGAEAQTSKKTESSSKANEEGEFELSETTAFEIVDDLDSLCIAAERNSFYVHTQSGWQRMINQRRRNQTQMRVDIDIDTQEEDSGSASVTCCGGISGGASARHTDVKREELIYSVVFYTTEKAKEKLCADHDQPDGTKVNRAYLERKMVSLAVQYREIFLHFAQSTPKDMPLTSGSSSTATEVKARRGSAVSIEEQREASEDKKRLSEQQLQSLLRFIGYPFAANEEQDLAKTAILMSMANEVNDLNVESAGPQSTESTEKLDGSLSFENFYALLGSLGLKTNVKDSLARAERLSDAEWANMSNPDHRQVKDQFTKVVADPVDVLTAVKTTLEERLDTSKQATINLDRGSVQRGVTFTIPSKLLYMLVQLIKHKDEHPFKKYAKAAKYVTDYYFNAKDRNQLQNAPARLPDQVLEGTIFTKPTETGGKANQPARADSLFGSVPAHNTDVEGQLQLFCYLFLQRDTDIQPDPVNLIMLLHSVSDDIRMEIYKDLYAIFQGNGASGYGGQGHWDFETLIFPEGLDDKHNQATKQGETPYSQGSAIPTKPNESTQSNVDARRWEVLRRHRERSSMLLVRLQHDRLNLLFTAYGISVDSPIAMKRKLWLYDYGNCGNVDYSEFWVMLTHERPLSTIQERIAETNRNLANVRSTETALQRTLFSWLQTRPKELEDASVVSEAIWDSLQHQSEPSRISGMGIKGGAGMGGKGTPKSAAVWDKRLIFSGAYIPCVCGRGTNPKKSWRGQCVCEWKDLAKMTLEGVETLIQWAWSIQWQATHDDFNHELFDTFVHNIEHFMLGDDTFNSDVIADAYGDVEDIYEDHSLDHAILKHVIKTQLVNFGKSVRPISPMKSPRKGSLSQKTKLMSGAPRTSASQQNTAENRKWHSKDLHLPNIAIKGDGLKEILQQTTDNSRQWQPEKAAELLRTYDENLNGTLGVGELLVLLTNQGKLPTAMQKAKKYCDNIKRAHEQARKELRVKATPTVMTALVQYKIKAKRASMIIQKKSTKQKAAHGSKVAPEPMTAHTEPSAETSSVGGGSAPTFNNLNVPETIEMEQMAGTEDAE